jgi:uncharacterized protein involved in outer membrane biogenesis
MSTMFRQPIQRKLSALLGADVAFDKLNVSLIGGVIEAAGITVTGEDKSLPPILTIGRVRAQIAVGRALKGEFVVRSLTIEKPVVHFVRQDGRTNLPSRAPGIEETTPVAKKDDGDDKVDKTSWKFDVEKVLLVDGQVIADVDARAFSAKPVLAELKRVDGGYELTLLSDVVSLVGSLRATARITGAADLAAIAEAALDAEVQIGDLGQIKFTTPRLRNLDDGELSFRGGLSIAKLRILLKQARA